jgi:5-oxoprolinase (ATP-hydrolysing)
VPFLTGVHTHMTNTRITDPEILERRFPVVLRRFILRPGSGGPGRFRGGDGVIRELEFRRPLVVSILSERRSFQPYGLAGGKPGARGLNLLVFARGDRAVNLGSKNTVAVDRGDRLIIHTPGGGGFGAPTGAKREAEDGEEEDEQQGKKARLHAGNKGGGSLNQYRLDQESA